MDRYTISLRKDKREFLYPAGEWVLYGDVEKLEAEILKLKEARIYAPGLKASYNAVKADAIREMIHKTQCQSPALRVVQDMLDYADNLKKN